MAPGGNKRKRGERQFSQDDGAGRPSPHRPENLNLAQQNQHQSARGGRGGRGGGSRRGSGSGQGGQGPRSPTTGVNNVPAAPRPSTPAQRDLPVSDRPSRPATPAQKTATPVPAQPAEPPKPPAPYAYEYITDEVVQDGGQQVLLDKFKQADDAGTVASIMLQELIRASLDGKLDAATAGSVVKEMISQRQAAGGEDIQSLFLDTVSLLDESDTKNAALLNLVAATDIDPEVVRAELDVPLLQALGLVRSTFMQMRARKTTNLLYRQANFNLLREETEGYSKLITEYFNTAQVADKGPVRGAEDAFQRVKALVGAFDLDVGRVLDITLDVFANLLVQKYRFFVKFLRVSSWWPEDGVLDNVKWDDQRFSTLPPWALSDATSWGSLPEEKDAQLRLREIRDTQFWPEVQARGLDAFFDLGARKIVDYDNIAPLFDIEAQPELDAKGKETNADRRKRINETRRYMKKTRTLPPQGNPDAAQLLGFKLRYYASQARDQDDKWHDNLIHLAGFLIKIGFISLRDLYPHLYPPDEEMAEVRQRMEKEKAENERKNRPGGAANALAMAGALADDTVPAVRTLRGDANKGSSPKPGGETPKHGGDSEQEKSLPQPADQKLLLLKSLLLFGALPEALYMLGSFPWLMELESDLPAHFHRILNHMLSKVADDTKPLHDRGDMQQPREQLADSAAIPKGFLKMGQGPTIKLKRWAKLDACNDGESTAYRFFWEDWMDNVPVCQSVDDVFLLSGTLLNFSGVKIGQDSALYISLVRIAKKSLAEDTSEQNHARWLDLMKKLLVPALSLSKHNPDAAHELWELLRLFPIKTRFNLYAEWYTGKTSRLPDIRSAFELTRLETKEVLKRVSNESGKKQARALAKATLSSPGIVMQFVISQLESYSNMVPSLVECTRYFSDLAYDILTWSLINALSGQGRDRMQADGMLTSPWLQALSQFAALLWSRFSVVNPSPVLQFLASELRTGNSTDLEVLEQTLSEMAGIKSDMTFNDAQVLAMAGGEVLQSQIVQQLADTRHLKKPQSKRLIKALAEPGLIGQLLIAIAQERQMYAHHDGSKDMPLKVLGNNLDKIQQVFAQYLDTLKSNLKSVDFDAAVPDVITLISEYGLEPGTAFTIARPSLSHYIAEAESARKLEEKEEKERRRRSSQVQKPVKGDSEMLDADAKPAVNVDVVSDVKADPVQENGDIKAEMAITPTPAPASPGKTNGQLEVWNPVLVPLIDRLSVMKEDLAKKLSLAFYVTFWTLAQEDVFVHNTSYEVEMAKQIKALTEINKENSSTMTSVALKAREKRKKDCSDIKDRLHLEMKNQIGIYQQMRIRLSKEKDYWFSPAEGETEQEQRMRHIALLQECFLPRAMLSSLDAHYCWNMLIRYLHGFGTPGFSTSLILSELFARQRLTAVIFQCTSKEAEHIGRFLSDVLTTLKTWHADKNVFEKEALGSKRHLPGFRALSELESKTPPFTVTDYEAFRRILFGWHGGLNGAFKACFESGEYMHIKNAIIILKAVHQVFPAVNFMGREMYSQVEKLSQEEKRQDLKLTAMSLLGALKSREKSWVLPQAFRLNEPTKDALKPGSRAPSARAETPQPSGESKPLDAAASEFKPSASTQVNGTLEKASKGDAEDGEIEDEKQAAVKVGNADDPANSVKEEIPAQAKELEASSEAASQAVTKAAPKSPTPAVKSQINISQTTDSKPSTPAPLPARPPLTANGPSRPDMSRTPSTQSSSTRIQHSLPNRLDGPPSRTLPSTPNERPNGRYGTQHDPRESVYGRLDRPNDARPPSRDHSPGGRRRERTPERGYPSDRDRRNGAPGPPRPYHDYPGQMPPPPYDSGASRNDPYRGPPRDSRTQPNMGHSRPAVDDRTRPNGVNAPSAAPMTHPQRAGRLAASEQPLASQPANRPASSGAQSERPLPAEGPASVNPQRLARIMANGDDTTHEPPRAREDRRERLSRPQSPRRGDDRATRQDNIRNDRSHAPTPEVPPPSRAPREQPNEHAPTGPRGGRAVQPPSKDLFEPNAPPRAMPDPSQGRLNRESGPSRQQESSYGRLNAAPDAPSGPRAMPMPMPMQNGPASRGGRNFPPNQSSNRNEPPLPSPSTARPPESPASFRGQHQHQHQRQSSNVGVPPTSSAPPTPAVEPNSAMEGVHPSRMGNVGVAKNQPPRIQTNVPYSNTSRTASSPTSAPPSGPRGRGGGPPSGTPTGPAPLSSYSGPPSGPASALNGRRGTDRSDKRFLGINSTLQNANGQTNNSNTNQGVTVRGAARQASMSMSSAANAQPALPPQAVASPIDPPQRSNTGARPDVPPMRAEYKPDLFQGRSTPNDRSSDNDSRAAVDGRHRRRHDERPERHHTSRGTSQDRQRMDNDPMNRPPPPPRGVEDERDPRNGPRRDERRPPLDNTGRDGPPRDRRDGPDRAPRVDDGPSRRAPLPPNAFNAAPQDFDRGDGGRRPRDDGGEAARRGRGAGEDFRGGRRGGDDGNRGPPDERRDNRKRRGDEGPSGDAKRRRSGRQ